MKLHMQMLIAIGLGLKRNWHIFLGLILGIFTGVWLHSNPNPLITNILYFVGQLFIRFIQMVVIPLVISAIVIGITSIGDSKQLSKLGIKMIGYYTFLTVVSVALGTGLALTFKPGLGAASYINMDTAMSIQSQVSASIEAHRDNFLNMVLNVIPHNPLSAIVSGDMVPIIVFAVIFALALAKVGEINRPFVSFFESIFAATMKITDWIMILAAPGVFALTAVSVSAFGVDIFMTISKYLGVLTLGFAIQLFVIYPIFLRIFSKVPVLMLYAAIAEAMMVAFGTASSSATLPLTIACCEKRGISHKVTSFVIPLGATLNMDGTALLQVVAVMFLAQAYGVTLTIPLILQIGVLAIIASSTSAGIPGAGLITIALVLNGIGLNPDQLVAGFAFLFTIERITDMMRTLVNVTSDAVVAATIADNENEINYDLLNNPDEYNEVIE
ncbi:MAG: dicarboxylate/amino acid:cation symporter [bacterium]|nr:dicarboxylate/amino acid:cation symporter [bacterium]